MSDNGTVPPASFTAQVLRGVCVVSASGVLTLDGLHKMRQASIYAMSRVYGEPCMVRMVRMEGCVLAFSARQMADFVGAYAAGCGSRVPTLWVVAPAALALAKEAAKLIALERGLVRRVVTCPLAGAAWAEAEAEIAKSEPQGCQKAWALEARAMKAQMLKAALAGAKRDDAFQAFKAKLPGLIRMPREPKMRDQQVTPAFKPTRPRDGQP